MIWCRCCTIQKSVGIMYLFLFFVYVQETQAHAGLASQKAMLVIGSGYCTFRQTTMAASSIKLVAMASTHTTHTHTIGKKQVFRLGCHLPHANLDTGPEKPGVQGCCNCTIPIS